MARIARVVLPGVPHHVTQRGNRRQQTFFSEDDYQAYVSLLVQACGAHGTEVWAWCLMPNHVHLVLVPSSEDQNRRQIYFLVAVAIVGNYSRCRNIVNPISLDTTTAI
ncbi:MAG: transposase [Nevskiales bacterium]